MAVEYIRRLIVSGPETSETLDLSPGKTIVIGRQSGNDVRLNNPIVSRRHAQVECTPASCQVTDLGSANGTSLDGQPLEANAPAQMKNGSKIEIGPFQIVLEEIPIEPAPPPEEKPKKPRKKAPAKAKKPPEPKPEPPKPPTQPPRRPPVDGRKPMDFSQPPPGLSRKRSRYLEYLPGIYQTDFMARFLAIFESVLTPIEWNVDNFDLYLNPKTTPEGFLPWLANWFSITFDSTWSEEQRRTLVLEAHDIFARRGTRWALSRVLEIYTGQEPEILDLEEDAEPFTFTVKIPLGENEVNRALIEQIVDANKPAHTNYTLQFKKSRSKRK